MAESADAADLKSAGAIRAGSSPAVSTIINEYRGVEQLVACRAHNPKVAWFESRLRNQNKSVVGEMPAALFLSFNS